MVCVSAQAMKEQAHVKEHVEKINKELYNNPNIVIHFADRGFDIEFPISDWVKRHGLKNYDIDDAMTIAARRGYIATMLGILLDKKLLKAFKQTLLTGAEPTLIEEKLKTIINALIKHSNKPETYTVAQLFKDDLVLKWWLNKNTLEKKLDKILEKSAIQE